MCVVRCLVRVVCCCCLLLLVGVCCMLFAVCCGLLLNSNNVLSDGRCGLFLIVRWYLFFVVAC